MDEILGKIDSALAEKGLSDAAASKLAVNHPNLLKNWRNAEKNRDRKHPFESLALLADVLGLEFYFGPPRAAAREAGFREEAATFFSKQAERAAYPVLQPLEEAGYAGIVPDFTLSRRLLDERGLDPANLRVIRIPDGQGDRVIASGTAAVIHQVPDYEPRGDYCAYFSAVMGGVQVSRLTEAGQKMLIRYTDNAEDGPPQLIERNFRFKMIGPIVFVFRHTGDLLE